MIMTQLKYMSNSFKNIFDLSLTSLFFHFAVNAQEPMQLDYLIKGPSVFDGSGTDSIQNVIGTSHTKFKKVSEKFRIQKTDCKDFGHQIRFLSCNTITTFKKLN